MDKHKKTTRFKKMELTAYPYLNCSADLILIEDAIQFFAQQFFAVNVHVHPDGRTCSYSIRVASLKNRFLIDANNIINSYNLPLKARLNESPGLQPTLVISPK